MLTSTAPLKRILLVLVVVAVLVTVLPQRTAADSAPAPRKAQADAPGLIVDPTIDHDDPAIVWDPGDDLYRMYTSDTWADGSVPEYVARRPTGPWTDVGNVLAALPTWEGGPFQTWAPEVADINGVWTLWGSTSDGEWGPGHTVQCIYRATAPTPDGPFVVDPVRAPCDSLIGGDIDPSPVKIGDQWWLLDKDNSNPIGIAPVLYSQRIAPDGELTGPRYPILSADLPWEDGLVEAPNFVESPDHQWWLIVSGGNIDVSSPPLTYRIAAVPCAGPEGGCDQSRMLILVKGNQQGAGPGEQDAFVDRNGQWWLAYNPDGPSYPNRPLALVELNFDPRGIPYVSTPISGQVDAHTRRVGDDGRARRVT